MDRTERHKPAPVLGRFVRDGVFQLRVEGLTEQLALGTGMIAAVTLVGWAIRLAAPGATPAALLFPAILVASLIGGRVSGGAAGALALAARTFTLRPHVGLAMKMTSAGAIDLALFALAASALVVIGAYARFVLRRLARSRDALSERNLYYATLFDIIPEGFAVCEAIRNRDGRLVDYTIVEINPALRRLLGVGPEVVGSRLTDSPADWTRWLEVCDRVLTTGDPVSFERFNRERKLWHEVHLSRLTPTRMAQFFFDITERKASEARQAELFDELNHRVKNNLAMVASLLQLQARGSRDEVRSELTKAAARVQSIAEVHSALTRDAGADTVDFGTYLKDLCESLRSTLVIEDGVALGVEAEPATLQVDAAIPLGMVVNELVTNAVKYAYPNGERGPIDVGFKRDGAQLVLTVRDQGQGLPGEAERREGGLGMRLVRSLVEQVGGELIIRDGPGAAFEIRMNGQSARPPRASP